MSSGARTTLLAYVRSLEDWASGVIKWHLDTGRYQHLDSPPQVAAGAVERSHRAGHLGGADRITARREPAPGPGQVTFRALPGVHR